MIKQITAAEFARIPTFAYSVITEGWNQACELDTVLKALGYQTDMYDGRVYSDAPTHILQTAKSLVCASMVHQGE